MPEFNKIDNIVLVSNPPERSAEILLVFLFKERKMYTHLSIHLSIMFSPSLDSKGIVFSL